MEFSCPPVLSRTKFHCALVPVPGQRVLRGLRFTVCPRSLESRVGGGRAQPLRGVGVTGLDSGYGMQKEVAETMAVGGASWKRDTTLKGSLQVLESRSQEGSGCCTLQTGRGEGAGVQQGVS